MTDHQELYAFLLKRKALETVRRLQGTPSFGSSASLKALEERLESELAQASSDTRRKAEEVLKRIKSAK